MLRCNRRLVEESAEEDDDDADADVDCFELSNCRSFILMARKLDAVFVNFGQRWTMLLLILTFIWALMPVL